MPKSKSLEKSIDTNSHIENWAVFLKDADNPAKQEVIEKLTEKEAGLMQAQKSLSSISADRDLWIAQYRQEMLDRDQRSSMQASMREGLEKGMKQGIKQGLEKGMKQGSTEKAVSLAKKYMSLGHSAEEAAAFAEIDVSELK